MANQMNEGLIQTSFHVQIKANFCAYNAHSYTAPPLRHTHMNTLLMSCLWFMWALIHFHFLITLSIYLELQPSSSIPFPIPRTPIFYCSYHLIFLPGESCGQKSLAGYSPQDHRVQHDWSDLVRMHHLITKVIYYVSCLCLLLESKFHEGGGFCLFSSWVYPKSHAWHMVGAQ